MVARKKFEPFPLDDLTKERIMALINTCKETGLGNVSFHYYPKDVATLEYHMSQYKDYWELVVVRKFNVTGFEQRDIYKVNDNELVFDYSEVD